MKESGGGLADVPYPSVGKAIKVARAVSSGGWDGAPLLLGFIVFPTGAHLPLIYTQTQGNARRPIKKPPHCLTKMQI